MRSHTLKFVFRSFGKRLPLFRHDFHWNVFSRFFLFLLFTLLFGGVVACGKKCRQPLWPVLFLFLIFLQLLQLTYSPYRDNPLECSMRGCRFEFKCQSDANGYPLAGSCALFAPPNTAPRTISEEYIRYLRGYEVLKLHRPQP